ncbi:hypothetical protein BT96DRAFT_71160 [Gymnopus androsaceus JB14]|uniref:AAA ATPase AAA+ lid domain-containing protein n=1 Tax=Gymnopus androsaceus JB14 TaxID=1447944 RepID=A0A6A4HG94_9AGAR|nr:hypothetical protein BT96DRAFT_71160 [Gymnopus androsaceus JB14]
MVSYHQQIIYSFSVLQIDPTTLTLPSSVDYRTDSAVTLPDFDQRLKILTLMLHDITPSPELSLEILARVSEGLSGSDLKEMCRTAAMVPVREYMRENLSNGEVLFSLFRQHRPLVRPFRVSLSHINSPFVNRLRTT